MTRNHWSISALRATDLDFAQKLRKLDLQIETVANGHGWIGTMAELRNALGNPSVIRACMERPIENWILNIRHT